MDEKMKFSEAMQMIKESEAGLSKEELQEMIDNLNPDEIPDENDMLQIVGDNDE